MYLKRGYVGVRGIFKVYKACQIWGCPGIYRAYRDILGLGFPKIRGTCFGVSAQKSIRCYAVMHNG